MAYEMKHSIEDVIIGWTPLGLERRVMSILFGRLVGLLTSDLIIANTTTNGDLQRGVFDGFVMTSYTSSPSAKIVPGSLLYVFTTAQQNAIVRASSNAGTSLESSSISLPKEHLATSAEIYEKAKLSFESLKPSEYLVAGYDVRDGYSYSDDKNYVIAKKEESPELRFGPSAPVTYTKSHGSDTASIFSSNITPDDSWLKQKKNLEEKISDCDAPQGKELEDALAYARTRDEKTRGIDERYTPTGVEQRDLQTYIRNGKEMKGFLLSEEIKTTNSSGTYQIRAVNEEGKIEYVSVGSDTVLAQVDLHSQQHLLWEVASYKFKGEIHKGVYLKKVIEHDAAAAKILEDPSLGFKSYGITIFVNGVEPGQGTIALDTYKTKASDKIQVLYKSDAARYDPKEMFQNAA